MAYLLDILISIDQLGNVIAGGNPDNTISARVGFYVHHFPESKKVAGYWKTLEWIIDTTFWPVDGKNHCHEAYHNDAGEFYDTGTKDWAILLLLLLIVPTCLLFSIILYSLYVLGIVSPKQIDRAENIDTRLTGIHASIYGTLKEIKEHPVYATENMIEKAKINVELAKELKTYIENKKK